MREVNKSNLQSEPSKKLYTAPHLVEYGAVEKLTHTGTGTVGDGVMTMPPCL
jgi:hypothetical protein